MNTFTRLVLLALCGLASASAQDFFSELFNPLVAFPPSQQTPMQQPQNGLWNNDVLVYRATTDGTTEKLATFDRAGVPTHARLQDGSWILLVTGPPRTGSQTSQQQSSENRWLWEWQSEVEFFERMARTAPRQSE